jgi:voltage-gated potassium channel
VTSSLRNHFFLVLAAKHRHISRTSSLVTWTLVALILASSVSVVIGSVEAIDASFGPWLVTFELFCLAIFSVEYMVRVWISVEDPLLWGERPLEGEIALHGLTHGHH